MENSPQLLGEIACTQCGGAGLELKDDGQVLCKFCGALNTPGSVCQDCLTVNPDAAEGCANCGATLIQTCPTCRSRNWIGRQTCFQCGTQLDALTFMADRYRQGTAAGQAENRRALRELKATEEEAAERRAEQMRAGDREREAAQAEARHRRLARERQLLVAVFIGLGALAALAGGAVILSLLTR